MVEEGAFVFALAHGGACQHAAGEAGEGEGLQPDFAGAGEGGQEQAFAAKERVLEPADELDVVIDARLEGDETAGVEFEGFAGGEKEEGQDTKLGSVLLLPWPSSVKDLGKSKILCVEKLQTCPETTVNRPFFSFQHVGHKVVGMVHAKKREKS